MLAVEPTAVRAAAEQAAVGPSAIVFDRVAAVAAELVGAFAAPAAALRQVVAVTPRNLSLLATQRPAIDYAGGRTAGQQRCECLRR